MSRTRRLNHRPARRPARAKTPPAVPRGIHAGLLSTERVVGLEPIFENWTNSRNLSKAIGKRLPLGNSGKAGKMRPLMLPAVPWRRQLQG